MDAPALVVGAAEAAWLSPDGEIRIIDHRRAAVLARETPPLVVHLPATARRLGIERFAAYDLLELFAFVRPGRFCLPSARGLAAALALPCGRGPAQEALALRAAAERLLTDCAGLEDARALARAMAGAWRWGPLVLAAMGEPAAPPGAPATAPFAVWTRLPEWEDAGPRTQPRDLPVEPVEARARLVRLVGANAEARPQQADYASAVSHAFLPRDNEDEPRFVLAEAGTGVGKTLGYLAPATVWAEKNGGAVWVSTYTRALQTQIDRELDRQFPDPAAKQAKVVLRKGRENYLCLLNLEEAVGQLNARPHDAVALGLMARWAQATRDGDLTGADFPGWIADLVGRARTRELADRRGECIYSACAHYRRCFIEHSARRARRADIVIANHALVMIQAALGALAEGDLPTRLVFDEGHHVFSAADSAFAAALTGAEAASLRRWLIGAEATRGRARGLKRRAGELCVSEEEIALLDAILQAARALPGEGWQSRLEHDNPQGPTEAFLAVVRRQVRARAKDVDEGFSIETEPRPPVPGLIETADALARALAAIAGPMGQLAKRLAARLDDEADALDSATRVRIEAVVRGLTRRGTLDLAAWDAMLRALGNDTPVEFVDWFAIDRIEGREIDIGYHRHWVDPTLPFAEAVAKPAHGVLVTSATLTDGGGDEAWSGAEARTGARHVPSMMRARVPSPFDYAKQTRVLVVNDLKRDDLDQIAAAYRELFRAAGGGGLGLFTAIHRLRAVRARIAGPLEADGIPLYAQHVDGLDTGLLIDIFRAEEDSCLLGTDAVRDGVDVPGRSLRLIVFDRVPWPRPDILHRARKAAFGGAVYDDAIVRLRLKQAFGRLVRRADDHGVFVLLDSRLPSRLASAFPEAVKVERIGLAEAIATTRGFLATAASPA